MRGAGAPVSAVPASLSRTSLVLARWLAGRTTTDAAGHPLPLPRVAPAGCPSFEALVETVTRDLRPRAVLDEWIDKRLAVLDGDDVVTLLERAYVPAGGDQQRLHHFGRNLHDHVAAAVANISADRPRFFERAVHCDGLSATLAAELERRSRDLAMDALTAANRDAHDGREGDAGGGWRCSFGVYIFAEERPGGDA